MTLQLLHMEYLEGHPEGYRYPQFCEHYRRWVKKQRRSMRQVHRAGEKLFTASESVNLSVGYKVVRCPAEVQNPGEAGMDLQELSVQRLHEPPGRSWE